MHHLLDQAHLELFKVEDFVWGGVQEYLVHKTPPPRRTLQLGYAQDPGVVLGGGRFLMSEVPLYDAHSAHQPCKASRNVHPLLVQARLERERVLCRQLTGPNLLHH